MISFSWPGVEPGDDIQTATHQLQDFPMNMRNSILSFLFIGGIIVATSLTGFGEGEPRFGGVAGDPRDNYMFLMELSEETSKNV